jgi:hypothetical protein
MFTTKNIDYQKYEPVDGILKTGEAYCSKIDFFIRALLGGKRILFKKWECELDNHREPIIYLGTNQKIKYSDLNFCFYSERFLFLYQGEMVVIPDLELRSFLYLVQGFVLHKDFI